MALQAGPGAALVVAQATLLFASLLEALHRPPRVGAVRLPGQRHSVQPGMTYRRDIAAKYTSPGWATFRPMATDAASNADDPSELQDTREPGSHTRPLERPISERG